MKMMVLRQLQQAAPGLFNRRRPATTLLTGTRGMTTGEDIMCGSEPQPEKRNSGTSARNAGVAAVESSSGSSSAAAERPVVVVERVVEVVAVATKTPKWWRPDPKTGTWVPEGYKGHVTTTTDVMKAASRVMRIRSDTTASLEDKRWWTSMEELPDMDRANPK